MPPGVTSEYFFSVFLIVGGFDTGFRRGHILETVVIDVSNSNMPYSIGDIPSSRVNAVGGLLGSSPVILGGLGYNK